MGKLRNYFLNHYPRTDFHELNQDWMISMLFDMINQVENFVEMNSVKYADPIQWDITHQYEKNTIVVDAITGTAYISSKPVPMGVALSRTEYWNVIFDLGRFITLASQNFANSYEAVLTTTATMPTDKDKWVVWNSILYRAKNDIHVGDRYVVDGNIEKYTVEMFFDELAYLISEETEARIEADTALHGEIVDESVARENADNTLQDNIDTEATARENADTTLQDNIDAEATARENADTTLQNNIDAEATARENADTTLQGNIDAEATARENAIDAEATARENADDELRSLITGDAGAISDRLNDFIDSRNEIIVNVKDFGAKGDGTTDDYAAIQNAIDSLPAGGGTVYFPAGNYRISNQINVGDGNASTTANGHASTKQNIKLIGAGCNRASSPNVTQITPLNTISSIINVRGLINNVLIDGFNLYVNGRADYGLFICATNYSTFKNIEIYNPTYCGLYLLGGHAPTGNYNTGCKFQQIIVTLATSSTIGLKISGDIVANNDTWLSSFEDCRFQSLSNTSNCTSGEFRFCDNITFLRCHFVTYSNTGRGIDLNALDSIQNNPFPTGLSFIDCSIANTNVTEDVANGKMIGPNRFYGYGITDGEVLPPKDNRLIGFDGSGRPFNGFGQFTLGNLTGLTKAINQLCDQTTMQVVYGGVVTRHIWGVESTMFGQICRVNTTKCFAYGVNSSYIKFAELDNNGTASNIKTINFS